MMTDLVTRSCDWYGCKVMKRPTVYRHLARKLRYGFQTFIFLPKKWVGPPLNGIVSYTEHRIPQSFCKLWTTFFTYEIVSIY